MIIFFGMIIVMVHGSAIYSPITSWPISHSSRQFRWNLVSIEKDHLEPKIFPTEIANCIIVFHFNFSWGQRWNFHYFSIYHVGKFIFLDFVHYKIKYLFWCKFFTQQIISKGLKLKFIRSKELSINFRFTSSVLN